MQSLISGSYRQLSEFGLRKSALPAAAREQDDDDELSEEGGGRGRLEARSRALKTPAWSRQTANAGR